MNPPPAGKAPRLTLRPQRALARGHVSLRATCNTACTLRATVVIRILGLAQSLRLAPARAKLAAPGARSLRLRLTAAGQRRLKAALALGFRARATVTVRATDRAGNTSSKTRTARVR